LISNLTIIVTTSYKYRALIDGFIFFFEKYWTNCPYKVIISLESEYRFSNNEKIEFFTSNYSDWSSRLYETVKFSKSEFILLLMDDYFIFEKISNEEISRILNLVVQNRIDHLSHSITTENKLLKNSVKLIIDSFKVIQINSKIFNHSYSVVSADFYRKEFLIKILRRNETAWEFENMASFRTAFMSDVRIFKLISEKHPLKYTAGGVINKGRIRFGVQDVLDKNNFDFYWKDIKGLNVSTNLTPIHIRIFRKCKRIIKYPSHLFINKFE